MKFKACTLAFLLAGITSFSALTHASQGNGTVKFYGHIIDAPCSVDPNSVNQQINMGQISNKILKGQKKSSAIPFQIDLKDCTLDTLQSVTVTFVGTKDAKNDKLIGITGTASGAGIGIQDGSGAQIELGKAAAKTVLKNGDNTLLFAAYLQGNSADVSAEVTAGNFESLVHFTLKYE